VSPKDFIEIRESLGLSPTELAAELGVTYQAVKDWQSGRRKISRQVMKQLACLKRLRELQTHNNQSQSDA